MLFRYLADIQAAADGGYSLSPQASAFFGAYLQRHGYQLEQLATQAELIDALRHCNAAEFDALLQKPAPLPGLRMIWHRLRQPSCQ